MCTSRLRAEFQERQQHCGLALISPVSQQVEKTQVTLQVGLRTRRIVMKPHYSPKAHAAGSAEVTRVPCPSLKGAGEVGHPLIPGL